MQLAMLVKHLRYQMHLLNKIWSHIYRHRRGWIIFGTVVLAFWVVRLFLMPPLLSGTHFSRVFYDRNDTLLRITLSADDKYRIYTPLDKINPAVIRATLLYEDKYFYHHIGINPIALARATKSYFSGCDRRQ